MAALDYVKASPALFTDPFVWGLSAEHKLLWCYLCHPPQAELHGIYRYDVSQMVETLKISRESILSGLELLETAGRIYTTITHVWIKRFFKHQNLRLESRNKVIHAVFMLEQEQPEIVEQWMRFYKVKSWAKQKGIELGGADEVDALVDPARNGVPVADVKPHGPPGKMPKLTDNGIPPLTEDEIAEIQKECA